VDAAPDASSEAVIASVRLEESDVRAAVVDLWDVRTRIGLSLMLVVTYVGMALVGRESWGDRAPVLLQSAVFLGILWFMPRVSAQKLRTFNVAGEQASYRFDAAGVTLPVAGAATTIAYGSIKDYREGESAFLIYSTADMPNIVPKRALTPGDLERVRAWLAPRARRARIAERLFIVGLAAMCFALVWIQTIKRH
jgi:hypothetical protein